jgi:diguanylate cyclase (GGDEF)-like protein
MSKKILVVEDDVAVNNFITQVLRRQGYEVMQAHDGARGLEMVHECDPDLVLSDIEMPRMGGIELAQELLKDPKTATLPVIFVTGRNELEARVEGLEYSVDYIAKPFAPPELLARVKAALRIHNLEQELRATNTQLEELALTDELTRISNRRGFEKSLTNELYRARRMGTPLALVMFDLDRFKLVNDTWGHAQGDVVLREFARLLRETSRHIDAVGRYGGEEFCVVLPTTDLEGARAFAEKVRLATESLTIPRITGDAEILSPLRITVSGGCAVLVEFQSDAETTILQRGLLRCADEFLYEAKQNGRNCIVAQQVPEIVVLHQGRASGE